MAALRLFHSHNPADRRAGMPLSTFVARLIWLCMLPLLLLAAWLAVDSVRTSQSDRDLEAANLAKNFATTIDNELNARIAALNVLAVSPLVDDASRWKDLYQEAQGFYQSLGSHVILADTGTQMHMLFNTRVPFGTELPLLPQPKGRAAAPTALETGKPAVGDTFFGPIAREPLVAIAVPAMREGRAAFLLLTIFETRQFQKHLDQMVLPSGWSLALLDGSGETIARHTRPGLNPEKDGDGAARFVVESTVSPWSVVLEIPPDVYRAPLLTAVAAMGAGILGATLASFLGGMLAGRRLGRSVASLAETPAPGAPLQDILEVAAARRLLDEAAERRATAEATLRVSEEKLRLFIEHAPVAIAMFDREMRYLAVSRRWMADYQLGDRDLAGQSHYEITPEIPDRWKETHRRGLEGEVVQTDEDAFVRSDGTVQWLRWVVRPWYTADGAVGGIVIFTEDISERKRTEEVLRRYELLAGHSRDIILFLNCDDGRILEANAAAIKAYGYSRDELLGLTIHDLRAGETRELAADQMAMAAVQGIQFETVHRRKGGSTFPVEVSSQGALIGGAQTLISMIRDITKRKKAEEALRASQQIVEGIINAIPVRVFWKDKNLVYLGCNKVFARDAGFADPKDIIGKDDYQTGWREQAELYRSDDRQVIESGCSKFLIEEPLTTSEGNTITILTSKIPLLSSKGEISGVLGTYMDITERKRSETAIQESRDRYRALFDNMLNGFAYCKMLFDDQGRPVDFVYLDVNQAFTRLTGLKNVVGRKVSDVIPGIREMSPELFEIYGRVAMTGKPETFEIYLKPLEIWLSISAYSLHREDFIAVFDNITERKRDEEALRVSHRFLEIVHDKREMAPLLETFMAEIKTYTGCEAVGIRVLDGEGRIPYRAYTGFSQEFFNLESPLSIKSDQCMCIDVIKGAADPSLPFYTQGGSFYMNATTRFLATVSEEDKGKTRNMCNHEGYESVALVPFRDGDRILGLIHVADRRESMVPLESVELLEKAALQLGTAIKRVRAGQELRESQERYRLVADYTYDWEYWVDPAGKFLYVSPSCERVSGYPPSFFLNDPQALLNIIHPEDRYKLESHINNRGKCSSESGGVEFRIITQTGEARWIDHKCWAVFSKEGTYMGRRGSNRDITQRLLLENQFRQSQKMEAVGRLAGGVAHDFNNMLGVIIGFTELASMKLPADDPIQMYMDEVKSAAKRSADITRQLLAFARKQTIAPKVLDLNDTIESMLKMLRRLIGEDIDLLWKPGKDIWPVKMDPAQIDQVLANLMVNARDAIAGIGKITIETGRVEFDAHYCETHAGFIPGKYVLLAVSDDGCGMDKETLAKLFEPFFTTKEVGKGTGLGLATIYGIVKQNGGFINVYSEPGHGTTFRIYLTRQEPQEAAAEQPRKPAEVPTGTDTVLLVEDEKSLLKFAGMLLEELGYTVLAAGSPREAIHLTKEYTNEIHLLMTDVVMPEMSGRDLWEQLKSSQPNLKCLFMSGYTANVIAHNGVLDEGVHFLQKPFSREALATKIREAIASTHSSMSETESKS